MIKTGAASRVMGSAIEDCIMQLKATVWPVLILDNVQAIGKINQVHNFDDRQKTITWLKSKVQK